MILLWRVSSVKTGGGCRYETIWPALLGVISTRLMRMVPKISDCYVEFSM
jgi:hypothetical protein